MIHGKFKFDFYGNNHSKGGKSGGSKEVRTVDQQEKTEKGGKKKSRKEGNGTEESQPEIDRETEPFKETE